MKTLRKKDTQYKIKEILHSGSCGVRGTKRTDGSYPLRIIDRIRFGYVVDFFYFRLIDFPVFNVADIYVTVSMPILFVLILTFYKDEDFSFLKPGKQ